MKERKDWTNWKVRTAVSDDAPTIVKLAQEVKDFILPYALSEVSVRNYIYRWVVVYNPKTKELGGAEHSIPNMDLRPADLDFLKHVCQMDNEEITEFQESPRKVLKAQPICPGKGTLRALIDWQKETYDEVWIWLSLKSTIRDFCIDNGITFDGPTYKFLNIWKADISEFSVGKWKKSAKSRENSWYKIPLEDNSMDPGDRLDTFSEEMKKKWFKGANKYGPVFDTDPIAEAMEECVDLALYAKVVYFRLEQLKKRCID